MIKIKKPARLLNPISNEVWVCNDITKIKVIDGVEFIEVHKEDSPRKFLINKSTLKRLK